MYINAFFYFITYKYVICCNFSFISSIFDWFCMFLHWFICQRRSFRYRHDVTFIIHRIYSKGYAYVTFVCVYRPEMCAVAACDTRSACRERDSPGIRFRKEGGTPRLFSSWYTLSLVRTSAKQMSHRSRSTDAHRHAMLVKIVSLGRNKSYFPSSVSHSRHAKDVRNFNSFARVS